MFEGHPLAIVEERLSSGQANESGNGESRKGHLERLTVLVVTTFERMSALVDYPLYALHSSEDDC